MQDRTRSGAATTSVSICRGLTDGEFAFLQGVLDLARRSAESTPLLLEHGADPHAGERSATEIAAFFGLDEMAALLAAASSGPEEGDTPA